MNVNKKTLALTFFVFLLSIHPISDTDFGWHLKVGEHIVRNAQVPNHDLFSFTQPNYQYVYYSWVGELAISLAYMFLGSWGVSLFYALILAITIIFLKKIYALISKKEAPTLLLLTITPIAHTISGGRMRIFGLFFLSIIYFLFLKYISSKSKIIWFTPLVFMLWANFHASFALGLAIITSLSVLYYLQGTLTRHKLVTILTIIGLSFCATLINPFFTRIWNQTFLITSNELLNLNIINPDWSSPFHMGFGGQIYIVLSTLLVIFIIFSRKIDLAHKITILIIYLTSLITVRFLFGLFVLTVPQSHIVFTFIKKHLRAKILNSLPVKSSIVAASIILSLLTFQTLLETTIANSSFENYMYYLQNYSANKKLYDHWSPSAYTYIKNNFKDKNLLTDANFGGLFILDNQNVKVFYYGAMDNFVTNGIPFPLVYLETIQAKNNWRSHIENNNVEVVLLPRKYKLIEALSALPNWKNVYEDKNAVVFAKI